LISLSFSFGFACICISQLAFLPPPPPVFFFPDASSFPCSPPIPFSSPHPTHRAHRQYGFFLLVWDSWRHLRFPDRLYFKCFRLARDVCPPVGFPCLNLRFFFSSQVHCHQPTGLSARSFSPLSTFSPPPGTSALATTLSVPNTDFFLPSCLDGELATCLFAVSPSCNLRDPFFREFVLFYTIKAFFWPSPSSPNSFFHFVTSFSRHFWSRKLIIGLSHLFLVSSCMMIPFCGFLIPMPCYILSFFPRPPPPLYFLFWF